MTIKFKRNSILGVPDLKIQRTNKELGIIKSKLRKGTHFAIFESRSGRNFQKWSLVNLLEYNIKNIDNTLNIIIFPIKNLAKVKRNLKKLISAESQLLYVLKEIKYTPTVKETNFFWSKYTGIQFF